MAITLAELNDTLAEQNDILYGVNEGVDKLSSNIAEFLNELKGQKYDQLEADREAANAQRREEKQRIDVQKSTDQIPRDESSAFDFSGFGGIGKLFAAGSLAGIGWKIGKAFLRRGIPALVLNTFAKELGDYVERETGSKEFGDTIFRAAKLGSLGLLLGPRFGILGAAIGAILTDENRLKLQETGDSIKKLAKDLDITIPDLASAFKGASTTAGKAITSINALLKGDFEGFTKDLDSLGLTMLGLAALVAPGALLRTTLAVGIGGAKLLTGALTAKEVVSAGKETVTKGMLVSRLAPFLLNPAVLAALSAGALAWWINSYTEDQKEQLQQLQDRIDTGAELSTEDWKLYQNLSTTYGKGPTSMQGMGPGGLVGMEPEAVPELTDAEKIAIYGRQQREYNEDRATDKFGKYYGRGVGFEDPRLIAKETGWQNIEFNRKPLEKPAPIASTRMEEELKQREKVSTKPIVVIQDGGTSVNNTVQNSQPVVHSMPLGFDHLDPFMNRAWPRP